MIPVKFFFLFLCQITEKTDGNFIPLIYMYTDTFSEYLLSARYFTKSFQNNVSFVLGNVSKEFEVELTF